MQSVDSALDERGWTRRKLAQEIGGSETTLSKIWHGRQHGSRHVDAICKVLGLPPPTRDITDITSNEWFELGELLRRVAPEEFERVKSKLTAFAQAKAGILDLTSPNQD